MSNGVNKTGGFSLGGIFKAAGNMLTKGLSKMPGPLGLVGKGMEAINKFSSTGLGKAFGLQADSSKTGVQNLSSMLKGGANSMLGQLTGQQPQGSFMKAMMGGQSGGQFAGNMMNSMLRGQGPMGAFQHAMGGGGGGYGGGGGNGVGNSSGGGSSVNGLRNRGDNLDNIQKTGQQEQADLQENMAMRGQEIQAKQNANTAITQGLTNGATFIK
jgi:hypothetical protein